MHSSGARSSVSLTALTGAVSITTRSKSILASRISSAKRGPDSNSAGCFGRLTGCQHEKLRFMGRSHRFPQSHTIQQHVRHSGVRGVIKEKLMQAWQAHIRID
jgi:hypothetical protein